jgi:hypothetical protein
VTRPAVAALHASTGRAVPGAAAMRASKVTVVAFDMVYLDA